ncbi:IgGFc-binding protein [Pseudophryne corroboree]|uniref:IgGFc-binding protein n=1 Tax=Pseudophryne corroboree TaxID=495146 RepID=UPI003081DA94
MGVHRILHLCAWIALLCELGLAGPAGTEFITTFMQNALPRSSEQRYELRITALQDNTAVSVTVFGGAYNRNITLKGGVTISVQLPASVEIRGSVTFINTVYVRSNKPITVVSLNYKFQSGEVSIVYPLDSLGTDYYLITPKTGSSGSAKVFSVLASNEKTSVKIHTKGLVLQNGIRYLAGSVISVDLLPFHGVQVTSADDLSGSLVTSSYPVAVLSGHTCAQKNTKCNHVYEQMLPVSEWGTKYFVVPLSFQQNTDLVYVIAAGKAEVTILVNNTQRKENMVAGQVLDVEISKLPMKIEASAVIQVTYFNTGGRGRRYMYDPFLMNILDTDSYCTSYHIYGQRGIDNYAIIIAETSSTDKLTFDGRPLIKPQWTAIGATGFSWLEYNFGNSFTSHKVDHPTTRFGLQSVGISALFSYGSPGTCTKEPGPPPPTCKTTLCPYRQVCVMQSGKPKCVRPQVDTCSASGDPHFKTFDQKYYDFMGTCTYNLTYVCKPVEADLPIFNVLMKNDNRGNVRVSYVAQVTVKMGIHTIVIKKGEVGYVRVDNNRKQLPLSLLDGTLKLFQSGHSAVIHIGKDALVSYDWNHILLVLLTRRYAGKMCGMCGNYNQNPDDDFLTPVGTKAPDAIAFGGSWMVKDNTFCWHDCRGPCQSCPSNSAKKYSTDKYCGLISKKDGPFSECHATADPKMYMDNCVFDACVNEGYKKISCDAVRAYAETCQQAGVNIKPWREAAGCPISCNGNSTYKLCGKACPATCQDPDGSATCTEPCVETCECNPGFVLSEGRCIPKASCGCSYNGFSYSPNDSFWNDTQCRQRCVCNGHTQKVECKVSPCRVEEECVVKNGLLGCYPKSFGVCNTVGDPHYKTYDGKKIDFQGTCTYLFSSLCDHSRGLTNFSVWVQNQNRGNHRISYATVVYIFVYGLEIQLSRQYPNKVMVNNMLINLPYRSLDGRVFIFRTPSLAVVSADFGLKVGYDFNSVARVGLPGTYAQAVCGLCGNFNGKPGDDLTPKGGKSVTDVATFVKSWKVGEVHKCKDDSGPVCATLSSDLKKQRDGAIDCGILVSRQGPFRDCHSLVDPEPYFEDCVFDYCILQKRQTVFCSDIYSYVMACQAAGGKVYPWRSQKFCPLSCPDHSSYDICADPCPTTCNGLSSPEGCDGNCMEGCVCNDGFMWSGEDCVPISRCGCTYNDVYYSVGQSTYAGDRCSQRCNCTEGGFMECAASSCSSNEECRVEKGVLGCHPLGSATCTAAGHSHYRTFDSRAYDFRGSCSYVLAESCKANGAQSGGDFNEFKVTVKHEKLGSGAGVIESVTVEVFKLNLTLSSKQRGVIQVNGAAFRFPSTLLAGQVRAECYGLGKLIKTSFGLLVTFDLQNQVRVTVPSNYRNHMCGLCGNYNGNAADDVGATPNEIHEFGTKWKVPGVQGQGCDGCGGTGNPCPSCQGAKEKIFSQKHYCGIISDPSGPFAKCHALVSPTSFLNDCVSDLCQTNGEDSMTLCSSIAVYVAACNQAGMKDITWRTDTLCPMMCWPHSHYVPCADMCSTSCASIADTYECSDLCDEGCECDEGYVFDGEDCIPLSQCGCFDNGRYYQAGETVLTDDCSRECTCNPISGLSCQNKTCTKGEKCQLVDGVRSCVNTDPCKSKKCRLKEQCQVQGGIAAVCVPEYTSMCWAWGDPHFHTLDGLDYDFQGTCTYILSKYTGNDPTLEPFQITIKSDTRGTEAASYVRTMEIMMHSTTVSINVGEFPQVQVNGESTNLPVTLAGGKLKVSQSGLTATVEAEGGLVVTFDWNWVATVTVPSSYYNSVSGLCGNFNQDPKDDQRTPKGAPVGSIIDWAGSWKVYDRDPFCFDVCPGVCPTCDEKKKLQYKADNNCGIISKKDGPFRECFPKVSPNKFFDACLFDVCMNDGAKLILCQALETYASTCLNEGVKLYDWRAPSGCPKICEDKNSHYNACGNACPAYCSNRDAPAKCTKPCVETCECNHNMVLSGDTCVPISSCGCQYNGRYYEPDQSFYNEKCAMLCKCDARLGIVDCQQVKCKDSEKCMVVNGIRGCYPTENSTCIASGDQYKTFDNKRFPYVGTCIYEMVNVIPNNSSLTPFTVSIQNDQRGNKAISFTKDVTLKVYGKTITISRDYPQQIQVDGILTSLPFYYELRKIMIYWSVSGVLIKTGFGLSVGFDGWNHVRVVLPSTYKGAVNGLCGNNNGDPSDDFTMGGGVTAKTPEQFGDHWKVGGVEGCTNKCSDCKKCNEKEMEPYKNDRFCGLLTKPAGPFSQCYASIDPTPYFDKCVSDACAFKGHQSVVCESINSYVSDCQGNGSVIKEWRTPSFCEKVCPTKSHYDLRGNGCPATCFGLTAPPTCVKSQTEGCYCDNGFILSGQDCVPVPQCGCVMSNIYYKLGQEFYTDNLCRMKCTCGQNGITTCRSSPCGANEECKVVDGVLGCHAKEFGQCVAWGDPHITSFDNVYYDLQTTCPSTLVRLKGHYGNYMVTVDKEPYGHSAVTKSVTVTIGDHVLRLERGRTWSIVVNEERYNLPYQSQNRQFWINEEGNHVIIQAKDGFKVMSDRQYCVSVWVPSTYAGITEGLCGNYNKNKKDDFRLPNGTIVTDPAVFGGSWAVAGDGSRCKGCTGDECPTCDKAASAEANSPTKCGMIKDPRGPFKSCHALVPPDTYASSCASDVCAGSDRHGTLCASLQAYTALCQEKGVTIGSWREIASCPLACQAHSHYALCTRTCLETCNGLTTPSSCTGRCFEGCECDTGYIFDGDKCVTMDKCGCDHNGRYLRYNESVLSADCSQECTCNLGPSVSCHSTRCAQDERCQLRDGVRMCVNKDPCRYKTCRAKESCKVQNDKAVCVPDFSGLCWAWGDPHFHSFDGLDFDFQGTCSYILAKYTGKDPTLEPFQITIKNDNRATQASSFVRSTEINMYSNDIKINVGEFPQIRVNDELTNLPVSLANGKLKVTQSGLTAIVEAEGGLVFTFDWNWHTTITVPSSYYNSVSGLCGNFNQDPKDDQRAPNGKLVNSTVDWAGLWKVYDRDPFCFDHCPGKCPTCEESKKQQFASNNNCGLIFKKDGPFRECTSKVDPRSFFDSCLFDVCMSDGAKNILCQVLETYAITCQGQGAKLYDWRTPSGCPKICEDKNSHYNACGNACPAYCSNRDAPANCTKHCVETCECNHNMVLSVNKCVPISNCGCQQNGHYYEPNQSWYDEKCTRVCKCEPLLGKVTCQSASCKDSEKCMVANGIRGCYPTKNSTCIASGDQYKTFDNKRFPYVGTCIYEMVNVIPNNSSLTPFTVSIQNDQRGNKAISFTKDVTLKVYGKTITISRDYPQQIQVDGILTSLPFYYELRKIMIYWSVSGVLIKTGFGLSVGFDGWNHVRVVLPSTYKGAVNGLCGNNNGDPSDDFTMGGGVTAKTPEQFGDHWKVGGVEGCANKCSDCKKCNEKEMEPYKNDRFCGLLTKPAGPFSQCYASIDPTPYFDKCVSDACAFKGHQSVVCENIDSYVSDCQGNGSVIKEWRTPSFCEKVCPSKSHYDLHGNGCPATCFGLTAPPTCVKSQTEGCYCDNGFILSGQDCVPIPQCGCVMSNTYYKLGQEFYTDNLCQMKCTCGQNGITTCRSSPCGANEECKVVDGVLGCHAKEFGQCVAWGDPHITSFDNVYYDLQTTCPSTLVRLKGHYGNYMVTVDKEPYGHSAVTKSVTVTIGDHVLRLERARTWSIVVNEERYNLPYQSQNRQFWINEEGNHVIIQAKDGFKVMSDRQYCVSVWVPSTYAGITEGLCGNYNKNKKDDFRLPNGTIVTDPAVFGGSWAVAGDGSRCKGCTGDECPTCDKAASAEANSPTKCGMIKDPRGPFKSCHALVPPDTYASSCASDVCAGSDRHGTLCASLQAYTALCQEKGVTIGSWREIASCPLACQAHSHYALCTRTCLETCNGLTTPSSCTGRCFEGCECDTGYIFDGDKCVTMDKCGCDHNGRYLRYNESVLSADCSQECTCNLGPSVSCRSTRCAQDERCQLRDGVRMCVNKDPCRYKTCRAKESCKVQNDKAVCVPDFSGLCWAWGDPHFHSFDGLDFDFQGTCSYILAKYTGKDPTLEPFQITIKNDNRATQASSFVRSTEINMYSNDIKINVGEFPQIRVNDELTNLPVSLANGKLKVTQSGLTAIVEAEGGLVFTFDWNWHTTVTVPSSYYNSVSGLCGNFNQDPKDDQRAPNGNLVNSTVDWAGLWKVYDRDPFCFDHCPGKCPTCEESKKQQFASNNNCGLIFKKDGPFRECTSKVDPRSFFDSCLFDVCMSDGAKNILCQVLETYAITCQGQGAKLYDWRTPSGCPKICEDKNSHYNACGNACPAYCSNRDAPANCTKHCVETCECNHNMVLSVNKCVPISNCGCQQNGRYYEPNQSWYDEKCTRVCKCDPLLGKVTCQSASCKDSEKCMVANGIRGCYPTKNSTCTATGDHYKTFDNKWFSHVGTCIYEMVNMIPNNQSLTPFTVSIQKEWRGNKAISFIKDVTLKVYKKTITMSRDSPQQIKVDEVGTSLPFYLQPTHLPGKNVNLVSVYLSGNNVIMRTDFGLSVSFDGWNHVRVAMPSTYKGAVNGLCGNNNKNPSDDFTMGGGATAKTPEQFGDHWKVGGVKGCTDKCSDCKKCNEKEMETYKNDRFCGLLTKPGGPFSQCYASIDPTPYFNNCLSDACASNGHQSVVCGSIDSYVSDCQGNGSVVKEWRTPSFCEKGCPTKSHHKLLGDGCPATCFGLKAPPDCVKSQTEGCYCDNGFILSGQDCVPIPQCGCVTNNTYYKLGQEFYTDNLCRMKCTCGQNGITTCRSSPCGANEECKEVDGVLGCHAKEFGQCVTWGDPHHVSFDNVYYGLQGTCSYALVRVKGSQASFLVRVDYEPYGNSAVIKSVTVTIGDQIIHLERERTWSIVLNSERYNLPCQQRNRQFWINEEGNNVIIQTKAGFKVMFDRQYSVSVWVPSSYAGITEGLCGNYNKNIKDDFRLPNGTIVSDPAVFGGSWAVAGDGSDCRGCTGDHCPVCTQAASAEANSPTKCGLLTDPRGPFKDCHALVPPERYANSCISDGCGNRGGRAAVCASLQAYMAICQEKGANVGAWRDNASCPLACPSKSHYALCTRTCDYTCNGLLAPSSCSDRCFEGCECDPGYIYDGDKCVTMNNCGCNLEGRYLKANEVVVSEDCRQRCTCRSGVVSCVNISCAASEVCQLREGLRGCQPRESQCTLRADHHFTTFDGVSGMFPNEGSYVMSSSCNASDKERFMVVVDVRKCSGKSKSGITLHILTSLGLISVNKEREVWLNGWELHAPSVLGGGSVQIEVSADTVTIVLRDQVTVTMNAGGEIKLIGKKQTAGNICGPCGNFNGVASDDLRLRNGGPSMDIAFTISSWFAKHLSPCPV